jgi:hypothetical protein
MGRGRGGCCVVNSLSSDWGASKEMMNGVVDIQKVRVLHCYKVTSNSPEVGWLLQHLSVLWGAGKLDTKVEGPSRGLLVVVPITCARFYVQEIGNNGCLKTFPEFMRALPLFPHLIQPIWQHSGSSSSVRSGCSKFLASFQCEWTKEHLCYYIHPPSDFGS